MMNERQLWEQFITEYPVHKKDKYVAWQYGILADELAELTKQEIKTATSSAYDFYILEGEALPKTGEWNIILNSQDKAVCITRTTAVSIVPYNEVTSEYAYKEGEGNRSLEYWKTAHKEFYSKEYEENGLVFKETIPIVCEEFKLMYK